MKVILKKTIGKILALACLSVLSITSLNAQPVAEVMIGDGTGTVTGAPNPYYTYYYGMKHQYLIKASELTAAGAVAGEISAIGFDVVANSGLAMTDFTVSIKETTLSDLTTTWETGLTEVFSAASFTPVANSINVHDFTTNFVWDGTSNIIIETCYNNTTYAMGHSVKYTTSLGFNATHYYQGDNSTVCSSPSAGSTLTSRPNIQFLFEVPPDNAGVTEILQPSGSFCSGENTVSVNVHNFGNNIINSVNVNWKVDGVLQQPVVFNSAIDMENTAAGADAEVELGIADFPFDTAVEIIAWTSMPNGISDTEIGNDSTTAELTANLQGIIFNETLPDIDICQGSPVSVDAGEFPNSNYVWSNGELTQSIDVSESGTYWVWVYNTDGCEAKDTFEVTQLPNPVANSIQIEDLGNREFRFHIIGENFVDEYSWNFGDGSPLETGGGAKTHLFEETGTYEVEVTLSNDCNDLVLSYTLTVTGGTTGIDDLKELAKLIKLYPNPASKLLHIQNESKVKMNEIKIFDILGREVFRSGKIDSQQYEVDVEGLTPGSYQVLIYTDKGIATKTVQVLNK